MNTFTPPGLPAFQAQQALLAAKVPAAGGAAAAAVGGFSFDDFIGGVLEIGRDIGASIMQIELFERGARSQAEIARIIAAGGGVAPVGSATPVAPTKAFNLANVLSDPTALAIIAVGLVLLVFVLRKTS